MSGSGDCSRWDLSCQGRSAAAEWFNEQVTELAKQLISGTANLSASIASAWVEIPLMPSLGQWVGGGVCEPGTGQCTAPVWQESEILIWFQQTHILGWWVGAFMVLAMMTVGIRMMTQQSGTEAREAVKGLLVFALVVGAGTATVQLLLHSGDQFSAYLLQQSVGGEGGDYESTFGDGLAGVLFLPSDVSGAGIEDSFWLTNAAGGVIVAILLLLFSLLVFMVQLVILVIRGGLLLIMVILLPAAAALVMTQKGKEMFGRYAGWLLALILYKPAAAILYATAFRLGAGEENLLNVITGMAIFVLSLFMLPALLRLIVPATAAVAGGGGTGGLAAAGVGAVAATGAISAKSMMGTGGAATTAAGGGPGGARGGAGPSGGSGGTGPSGPSGADPSSGAASQAARGSGWGSASPGGAETAAAGAREAELVGGGSSTAAGASGAQDGPAVAAESGSPAARGGWDGGSQPIDPGTASDGAPAHGSAGAGSGTGPAGASSKGRATSEAGWVESENGPSPVAGSEASTAAGPRGAGGVGPAVSAVQHGAASGRQVGKSAEDAVWQDEEKEGPSGSKQ